MSTKTKSKPAKRTNGEGTVYQRSGGSTWVGEVVIDGQRHRTSGRTKSEAAGKLRELIHKHEMGDVDSRATVRQLVDTWMTVALPTRKMSATSRNRKRAHAELLIEHLGTTQLRLLSAERIEAMYAELLEQRGWSHASFVGLRSTFGQMLRFGQGRKLIADNPALLSVIPADARGQRVMQALTDEQARELWKDCKHHRFGVIWRLMLMTGLRPSEALGLVWSSVDLDSSEPSITISRAVVLDERGKAQLVDGVKTDGSYRSLAIPAPLVPVLRAHRTKQAADRLAASEWDDADLVFATGQGRVLTPGNVRRDFHLFLDAHGLPRIGPNELRHTAATLLYDAGLSLDEIADVLGHRTTRMLSKHYRHRRRKVVSVHAAALAAVVQ